MGTTTGGKTKPMTAARTAFPTIQSKDHADAPRGPSPACVSALDITVLAGGPGSEREVSLNSGRAVHEALVRLGHRVEICDIGPADLTALDRPADIVFIALHGEFGEDGTIQSELDRRGMAYCGCDAASSRLAMNKVEAKRSFQRAGIPTPAFVVANESTLDAIEASTWLPAVVKPIAAGSSVDTSIVRGVDELRTAAAQVVDVYGEALIERYIDGPELTVSILGERALPVCEIRPAREFYDYHAKYIDDDTQYLFDPDLPEPLLRRVQSLSLQAHKTLGCRVVSRVDWMIDGSRLEPYILEINTIPGFTNHSLLPKAAARMGLNFDALCQRIVELSLQDHRREE